MCNFNQKTDGMKMIRLKKNNHKNNKDERINNFLVTYLYLSCRSLRTEYVSLKRITSKIVDDLLTSLLL